MADADPLNPPAQPNANADAAANTNAVASGSQLFAIKEFPGEEGIATEVWVRSVDRAQTQFKWTNQATSAAAKARLTSHAATWLRAQEGLGNKMETWQELREHLLKRFYPVVTQLVATEAVSDLKMKPNETCSMFLDRVTLAVQKKNHKLTAAEKNQPGYQNGFKNDVYCFFAAGLPTQYRRQLLRVAKPPESASDLLDAARALESQEGQKRMITVDEIGGRVEKLTEELAALGLKPNESKLAGSFTATFTGSCFYCGKKGHMQRNCFARQRTTRGGRGRGRTTTRGRSFRPNRGTGRGTGRNNANPTREVAHLCHGGNEFYDSSHAEDGQHFATDVELMERH